MTQSDCRATATLPVGVIAVAAMFVQPFAAGQPVFDPVALDDRQRELVERLQDIQARDGLNSPDSIAPLQALSLIYEEDSLYSLAAAAHEQALYVVRFNFGIHSLEQVPLLQQAIRREEATGNHAAAWDLEQELLTLLRRQPEDLRTVPTLREVADKRIALVGRYLSEGRQPEIVLGCFYDWYRSDAFGSCSAGSKTDAAETIVFDAQRNYADAIAILLRNELYTSEELRALELELVRSSDLARYRNQLRPGAPDLDLVAPNRMVRGTEPWRSTTDALLLLADWDIPDAPDEPPVERGWLDGSENAVFHRDEEHAYRIGRHALQRLYTYTLGTPASAPEQAAALVAIADWDLLYSHNGLALEGYALAHGLLADSGNEESISELFARPEPIALPTFAPAIPADAETWGDAELRLDTEAREPMRYVDFAFEISKYGRTRKVDVMDAAIDAKPDDQARLSRLIARTRFRPRLDETGSAIDSSAVVRYYAQDPRPAE